MDFYEGTHKIPISKNPMYIRTETFGYANIIRSNLITLVEKNDPAKDRKALATYVELKGYSNGGDRQAQCQNGTLLSLDEIAKELNNLQRALRIERNLTDSMKELLDTAER